jgi:hypothetical protein
MLTDINVRTHGILITESYGEKAVAEIDEVQCRVDQEE